MHLEQFPKMVKRTGRHGNKRTGGEHRDLGIIMICQNTKKRTRDLMGLAFTQTPLKNNQITLE